MSRLSVQELVDWSHSEYGGLIVPFSPDNYRTVCYFLREFAVPTLDPLEELGAFQFGNYLIVGKSRFRVEVSRAFKLVR